VFGIFFNSINNQPLLNKPNYFTLTKPNYFTNHPTQPNPFLLKKKINNHKSQQIISFLKNDYKSKYIIFF